MSSSNWKIIPEEDTTIKNQNLSSEPSLDLSPPKAPIWKKAGVTGGVIALFIAAFTFAPWNNPIKNFMADITDTGPSLEDLFGQDTGTEQATSSPLDTSTGSDLPEPEIDSLEALFGNTTETSPELPNDQDDLNALFGIVPEDELVTPSTETAIPTPVELAPLPQNTVNYDVDTVSISPALFSDPEDADLIEAVTPLPEVSPIVTSAQATITPVTENLYPSAPIQPPTLNNAASSPFPINTHTVSYLPPQQTIAQGASYDTTGININEPLRNVAPPAAQINNGAINYSRAAKTGPETVLIAFLLLFSMSAGLYLSQPKKKQA